MENLALLWEYQLADQELEAFLKQQKDTPTRKKMIKLQKFVKACKARIEEIDRLSVIRQNRVSELEDQNKLIEGDLTDLDQDIGYYSECDISELNEKAVQELVKNCERLLDAVNVIKKQLVTIRQEADQSDKEIRELYVKMKAAKTEYDTLMEAHKKELAAGEGEANALKEKAAAAKSRVPEFMLKEYERIKGSKANPVAILEDNRCQGCRMQLPSGVALEIANSDKLVECENCGRILILK